MELFGDDFSGLTGINARISGPGIANWVSEVRRVFANTLMTFKFLPRFNKERRTGHPSGPTDGDFKQGPANRLMEPDHSMHMTVRNPVKVIFTGKKVSDRTH
jgi:hypothetical protein